MIRLKKKYFTKISISIKSVSVEHKCFYTLKDLVQSECSDAYFV